MQVELRSWNSEQHVWVTEWTGPLDEFLAENSDAWDVCERVRAWADKSSPVLLYLNLGVSGRWSLWRVS